MKLFISAAETSSDIHGAHLVSRLKHYLGKRGEDLNSFGVGGPNLRQQGVVAVEDAEQLSAMGAIEVLGQIPKLLRIFKHLMKSIRENRPDIAVILDYPEFHLRLANRIKYLGIPIVYFIPPKLWVWRGGRIKKIKKTVTKVLSILPFEKEIYERAGVSFCYVGSPLADEIPKAFSRDEARGLLNISSGDLVITLMPGSRSHELTRHLPILFDFLFRTGLDAWLKSAKFLIAMPENFDESKLSADNRKLWDQVCTAGSSQIRIVRGQSWSCLRASDFGLIKSGTSTLEAAVLECPHIVFYRANFISEWLYKWIVRYAGPIALSNLFAGVRGTDDRVFPEWISGNATAANLILSLKSLNSNSEKLFRQQKAMHLIRDLVYTDKSPAEVAAQEIIALYDMHKVRTPTRSAPFALGICFRLISFLWSFVNFSRRRIQKFGIIKPRRLPVKVISIGNIQAGGAGKTPFVYSLARRASADGKRIAILLRGVGGALENTGAVIRPYQQKVFARDYGDEAILHHQQLPEVWIGVGKNRGDLFDQIYKDANCEIDLVLLDDGFQNFKIHKDIEVVLVTSKTRSDIPYREFASTLSLANWVIWTKGTIQPEMPLGTRLISAQYSLSKNTDQTIKSSMLLSGIADSGFLKSQLALMGVTVVTEHSYADHKQFNSLEIEAAFREADEKKIPVLTTGKDWVKLRDLPIEKWLESVPVKILEPNIELEGGSQIWTEILNQRSLH